MVANNPPADLHQHQPQRRKDHQSRPHQPGQPGGQAGGIDQGQGLGDEFAHQQEGRGDEAQGQPFSPGPPEAQGQGGGQHRGQDVDRLHPHEHRHQQPPGPVQEGHPPARPGAVFLFKAQAVQRGQGEEGGLGGGEKSTEQRQDAQGETAGEIGV